MDGIRVAARQLRRRPLFFATLGTTGGKGALAQAVRDAVRGMDRELPIVRPQPMEDRIEASLSLRRFTVDLLSAMALATLLLVAAGIYGVASYLVAQRTRELGVRQALGATPRRLVGELLRESSWTIALGALAGVAAGASLARFLRGFLFGVAPVDPLTFLALTLGLGVVAFLAIAAAAVRAARVHPADALRAL